METRATSGEAAATRLGDNKSGTSMPSKAASGVRRPARTRSGRPYRVLFVFTTAQEPAARTVAARLSRRTFDPMLCCIDGTRTVRPAGRSIVLPAPLPQQPGTGDIFRSAVALAQQLRSRNVDVVHSFGDLANVIIRIAARVTRARPAVITGFGEPADMHGRMVSSVERWTRQWADRTVVPSADARNEAISKHRIPEGSIVVISNPGGPSLEYARQHAHLYAFLGSGRRRRIRRRVLPYRTIAY